MPKKSNYPEFNFNGVECVVKCVDVYDGDTIIVEVNIKKILGKYMKSEYIDKLPDVGVFTRCRMAGYNSAEISRTTSEEKEKGLECKKYLSELILGKDIYCHFLDKKQGIITPIKNLDPYKRPLIDVFLINVKGGSPESPDYSKSLDFENPEIKMEIRDIKNHVNTIMINTDHGKFYTGSGKKEF